MDSNVHDNVTKPMDDTVSEDSTCQSSVVGKTKVNPEASQTLHSPAEKQSSEGDGFVFPKGRRQKVKLLAGVLQSTNQKKRHSLEPLVPLKFQYLVQVNTSCDEGGIYLQESVENSRIERLELDL